jgi:hypothetical protein
MSDDVCGRGLRFALNAAPKIGAAGLRFVPDRKHRYGRKKRLREQAKLRDRGPDQTIKVGQF